VRHLTNSQFSLALRRNWPYVVPSIEILEKIARVLEVPLHQLFYDGDELPQLPNLPNRLTAADIVTRIGRDFRHD
jgi:hypothetical protein